jgi:hypothetical protein
MDDELNAASMKYISHLVHVASRSDNEEDKKSNTDGQDVANFVKTTNPRIFWGHSHLRVRQEERKRLYCAKIQSTRKITTSVVDLWACHLSHIASSWRWVWRFSQALQLSVNRPRIREYEFKRVKLQYFSRGSWNLPTDTKFIPENAEKNVTYFRVLSLSATAARTQVT